MRSDMTTDRNSQLFDFEREADARIATIALAGVPVRAVWAHYHFMIFYFLHFEGARDAAARRSAETMTYRLSYILPWIAGRTGDRSNMAAAQADALFRASDPGAKGASALDAYAHFSEVLPDVRRGRVVAKRIKNGFSLSHPSPQAARAEATDIIVSGLAIPHIANRTPTHFSTVIKALAAVNPIDWTAVVHEAAGRIAKYKANLREDPVISDAAMVEVFGFSGPRFREIQTAVFALAEVCQELALIHYMNNADEAGDPSEATMDLVSISWLETEFVDRIAQLAGGDSREVREFIDNFTFDPSTPKKLRGGEGYTPPFARVGTQICWSPDLVLRFLQPRNALQDMMKLNKKKFDNLVSHTLEPTLVEAVVAELEQFSSLKVAVSTEYELGEIDLIILEPSSGDVVIVEVKGPIPPQGSRATERLTDRIREGLDQLRRFQGLSEAHRLKIVAAGTGVKLAHARFHYLIMARACLGAIEVWQSGTPAIPATLPLVRLALAALAKRGGNVAAELGSELEHQTAMLLRESRWSWSSGKMPLFGRMLYTPQLRYDEAIVDRWRRSAAGEAS